MKCISSNRNWMPFKMYLHLRREKGNCVGHHVEIKNGIKRRENLFTKWRFWIMYWIFSLLKFFNTFVLLSLMIMTNLLQSTVSLKGNWCKFEFTTAREQTNYNRDNKSTINSFLDFQNYTPITIEMINLKLTNFLIFKLTYQECM